MCAWYHCLDLYSTLASYLINWIHLLSQATDIDTGNGSVIWFEVVTRDAPFVADRDTGEVTTAGIFRDQSGTTIDVEVRAFDNLGMPPTQQTIAILSVSDLKLIELQV